MTSAGRNGRADFEAYFDVGHLSSDLKRKTVKSAGFTISSQVVNYGIQTVGTIVLARLLTPVHFGLIAMVAAFSLLIQNFGVNGIMEAIIQWEAPSHRQVSRLFWIYMGVVAGLTMLFAASAPLIVWFFKESRLGTITVAMAATILLGGLTSFSCPC